MAWQAIRAGSSSVVNVCHCSLLLTGQYKFLPTTELEYVALAHHLHFQPAEQHLFASWNQTNLHFNITVSFYLYKAFFLSSDMPLPPPPPQPLLENILNNFGFTYWSVMWEHWDLFQFHSCHFLKETKAKHYIGEYEDLAGWPDGKQLWCQIFSALSKPHSYKAKAKKDIRWRWWGWFMMERNLVRS